LVGVAMLAGGVLLGVAVLLAWRRGEVPASEAWQGAGWSACLSLMGLFVARFYLAGWRRRGEATVSGTRLDAHGQRLPDGPVLPARRLRFHPDAAGRPGWVTGMLLVCAGILVLAATYFLPSGSAPSWGVAAFQWVCFLLLAALAAFMLWLVVRFLQVTRRQRRVLLPDRVERWVPLSGVEVANLDLQKGVDVGNRAYVFAHPGNRSTVTLMVGVDESPPWVVEGHVLAVYPPGDPEAYVLVRVNGAPFALTPEEKELARAATSMGT
jgi:hypothetical protein